MFPLKQSSILLLVACCVSLVAADRSLYDDFCQNATRQKWLNKDKIVKLSEFLEKNPELPSGSCDPVMLHAAATLLPKLSDPTSLKDCPANELQLLVDFYATHMEEKTPFQIALSYFIADEYGVKFANACQNTLIYNSPESDEDFPDEALEFFDPTEITGTNLTPDDLLEALGLQANHMNDLFPLLDAPAGYEAAILIRMNPANKLFELKKGCDYLAPIYRKYIFPILKLARTSRRFSRRDLDQPIHYLKSWLVATQFCETLNQGAKFESDPAVDKNAILIDLSSTEDSLADIIRPNEISRLPSKLEQLMNSANYLLFDGDIEAYIKDMDGEKQDAEDELSTLLVRKMSVEMESTKLRDDYAPHSVPMKPLTKRFRSLMAGLLFIVDPVSDDYLY